MSEFVFVVVAIVAYLVGRWNGKSESERHHRENMASMLADQRARNGG